MPEPITDSHKKRFEEIRKLVIETGSKETTFIKVEQLFYEAMNISRGYGNDIETNKLLALFKKIEANEYHNTTALFRKGSKREQVIKRFINEFKALLATAIKS